MSTVDKAQLARSYAGDAERRSGETKDVWKVVERAVFLELLKAEGRTDLLEIGAGTGTDSLFFRENGMNVVCTDMSDEMILYCRERGLDARRMDFYELDFADASLDAVYAMNCLLHVPTADIDSVLAGIRRVLKPGGLFFFGVYGGRDSEGIWEDDWCEPKRFFRFYTDEAVQQLVSRHFELVRFEAIPLQPGKPHFQSMVWRKSITRGE